jgi:hypothetical protein
MMLDRRDGALVLAEADLSLSNFSAGLELSLEVLQNAGFDASEAIARVMAAIQYVVGNAFQAQADPFLRQHRNDEKSPHALELPIEGERFPRITAFLHTTDLICCCRRQSIR